MMREEILAQWGLACLLVVGTSGGCGPESAEEALADNVRVVCELGGGPCNYGGPLDSPGGQEWLDMCVEVKAREIGDRVREEEGEACFRKYAELYACAGKWTCEDFRNRENTPCAELNDEFAAECGFSPLLDRD